MSVKQCIFLIKDFVLLFQSKVKRINLDGIKKKKERMILDCLLVSSLNGGDDCFYFFEWW